MLCLTSETNKYGIEIDKVDFTFVNIRVICGILRLKVLFNNSTHMMWIFIDFFSVQVTNLNDSSFPPRGLKARLTSAQCNALGKSEPCN